MMPDIDFFKCSEWYCNHRLRLNSEERERFFSFLFFCLFVRIIRSSCSTGATKVIMLFVCTANFCGNK